MYVCMYRPLFATSYVFLRTYLRARLFDIGWYVRLLLLLLMLLLLLLLLVRCGLLIRCGCGEKLFFGEGGGIMRIEERGERRE